jgi:lysophospholipase L1-like esterase
MLRRILGLGLVALSVLTLGATPVTERSYYVALGDSLAAGYQPDPAIGPDEGYVPRIHRELGRRVQLRNFACGGATTATLLSGGGCAYPGAESQLAAAERFLRLHRDRVRLVTIDIGGNDVNGCVRGTAIDQACVLSAVGTAAENLGQIVRRLRAAAPRARIVGMTYYDPYLASWLAGPAGQAVARQSVQLTVLLNGVLTGVFTAAGVRVADVAGAFATTDLTTAAPLPGGGEGPLAVARICAWTWMCPGTGRPPDIHATSAGYAVIAEAFLTAARQPR